jgi:hypothetical protein
MQSTSSRPPLRVAAQWRTLCRLYPIYVAIAGEFKIAEPPYASLETLADASSPEVIDRVHHWLSDMDDRLRAHHFRHVLQNTDIATTEQMLHALVQRYLASPNRTETDRDKLDFLLAHYFAVCAPPGYRSRRIEMEDVAEVLEGVLGECSPVLPSWLAELDELIRATEGFSSLRSLVNSRVIERGRALKVSAGGMYFGSSAMVAFTRFNYVIRRSYLRLFEADVVSLEESLKRLSELGVAKVDCRSIGMDMEPVARLREIVSGLRAPRMTDYRNDSMLLNMMELRRVVDGTLSQVSAGRTASRRLQTLEKQFEMLLRQVAHLNAEVVHLTGLLDGRQDSAGHAASACAAADCANALSAAAASLPSALSDLAAPDDSAADVVTN